MNVEVLVATMNQKDHSLLEKMNIQTDAIIGNQIDFNRFEEFVYDGHDIQWFSFNEKGVGLNRNNILMRARGDILLFADDDVVYCDGYEQIILEYYESHPNADIVIFNFKMKREGTEFYDRVTCEGKVTRKSATKYGTYCISARREKLRMANVYFHLDFGGGTRYSCGEDSLFLQDCLKKGLEVYSTKKVIGILEHGESTWFNGYNEKFFFDKGVLYFLIDKYFCEIFAIYHCFKHRKRYQTFGWKNAWKQMHRGIRHIKKNSI